MNVYITDHARHQYARRFYLDFKAAGSGVDGRLIYLVRTGIRMKDRTKHHGYLLRNGRFIMAVRKKKRGLVLITVMRAANDE